MTTEPPEQNAHEPERSDGAPQGQPPYPPQQYPPQGGYPTQPGYPPQGGYPPQPGYPPQGPPQGPPSGGYQPQPGYPPQGAYPQQGYPQQGYPQQYPQGGYPQTGWVQQPPGNENERRRRPIGWMLLAGLVTAVVVAGAIIYVPKLLNPSTDLDAAAASTDIILDPATSVGQSPFSTTALATAPTNATPVSPSGTKPVVTASTSTVGGSTGLYSGPVAPKSRSCKTAEILSFFAKNPAKSQAWIDAQQADPKFTWSGPPLTPQILPVYIKNLTAVDLGKDTRVGNVRDIGGKAVPFQGVLQAGTAVLADDRGVPRLRCMSANPLIYPKALPGKVKAVGSGWTTLGKTPPTTVTNSPTKLTSLPITNNGKTTKVTLGSGSQPTTATTPQPSATPSPAASASQSPTNTAKSFTYQVPSGYTSALRDPIAAFDGHVPVAFWPSGSKNETNDFINDPIDYFAVNDLTGTAVTAAQYVEKTTSDSKKGFDGTGSNSDKEYRDYVLSCSQLNVAKTIGPFKGTFSQFGPCSRKSKTLKGFSATRFIFAGTDANGNTFAVQGFSAGSDVLSAVKKVLNGVNHTP